MADALASALDALEELGWDDRRVLNGIAALQSIVDINYFRQRVRALGVATQHRNAAGHWVNRRKADMLEDCRQRLKESHPDMEAKVQRRGAIRTCVVELGAKRYKGRFSTGRTTWRTAADIITDCDNSVQVVEKFSLPVLLRASAAV